MVLVAQGLDLLFDFLEKKLKLYEATLVPKVRGVGPTPSSVYSTVPQATEQNMRYH